MFLKSLKLNGFKAFSQKTSIHFKNGIGAFLGPNGCGKSNIIDSIKWVLGEQRPSEFRAKKMEDVIFNGSQSQKKNNMAEVELTIINDNNTLSIEYSEISITRRLYRNGDSEYLINSKPVRLKDIHNLFIDTTIGPTTIIEQGQIDQLLSKNFEERRKIFEQTASIYKYKDRKKQYEKELKKTQGNLIRLKDIHFELKKQYNTLQKQSEKTQKYLKFSDELKKNQLNKLLYQYIEKKKKIITIDKTKELLQKKMDQEKKKLKEKKDDLDLFLEQIQNKQDTITSYEQNLFKISQIILSKQNQNKLFEDRKVEINNSLIDKENEIDSFKKDQEKYKIKIETIEMEIQSYEKELKHNQESMTQLNKEINELQQRTQVFSKELKHYQKERTSSIEKIENIKSNYKKIVEELIEDIDRVKEKADSQQHDQLERKKSISDLINNLQLNLSKVSPLAHIEDVKKHIQDLKGINNKNHFNQHESILIELIKIKESLSKLEQDFNFFSDKKNNLYDLLFSSEGSYAKKEKMDNELLTLSNSKELAEKQIFYYESTIKKNQEKVNSLSQSIQKKQTQNSILKEKKQFLDRSKNEKITDINNLNVKKQKIISLLDHQKKSLIDIKIKLKENIKEIKKNHQKENDLKNKLQKHRDQVSKEKQKKEKFISIIRKYESNLDSLKEQYFKKDIDMKLNEKDINNIKEKALNEHSQYIESYEQQSEKIFDIPLIEKNIKIIKEQISGLGFINPLAKEEFHEISKRLEKQETQQNDIIQSIKDTEELIKELDIKSTDFFLETFSKIEKNFHVIFRRLFNGGQAQLKLTNPDYPLNSDIEILIQPPGKKLQHISLLSGGEKSLIAIALIFSMFLVKPSPFCLFDEIDAALDKSSILRLSNLLEEFKQETQFLIISHNEKMATSIDYIYGITMNDGESKVISLELNS